MGLQSAQSLGYILEDMGFKSWEKQENYLFSRTSRSDKALSLQIPACSLAVKWPGWTVWSLTSILESSLKNSGAMSPTMAQRVTNLFHLTTFLCQYPSRSYILWYYKGTSSGTTYLLHAHYTNNLFHFHWTNYINRLKAELNPSEQRYISEIFTGGF